MPVVHIYMYAGRSKEQKSEMVRRISKDFEEVLNVKPESLNVLFHDMPIDESRQNGFALDIDDLGTFGNRDVAGGTHGLNSP